MTKQTSLETDTEIAPARWASYALYGDDSGLSHAESEDDRSDAKIWIERLAADGWEVVCVINDEPYFCGVHGCDVFEYVLHRQVPAAG